MNIHLFEDILECVANNSFAFFSGLMIMQSPRPDFMHEKNRLFFVWLDKNRALSFFSRCLFIGHKRVEKKTPTRAFTVGTFNL